MNAQESTLTRMSKRCLDTGSSDRAVKTRPSLSMSALHALSLESAFQGFMQNLPTVIKSLIRDFACRSGLVRNVYLVAGGLAQSVDICHVPLRKDLSNARDELIHVLGSPFAVCDRVWVCKRALRTRSKGTVSHVIMPRTKANPVEDAKEKISEADEMTCYNCELLKRYWERGRARERG
jgi:hypothetical protein